MKEKCPYLSTGLECFAGSFGSLRCLDSKFHNSCEFKKSAQEKVNKNYHTIEINF